MPYLKQDDRDVLDYAPSPETGGELNYLITKMCIRYMKNQGTSYKSCNDVMGALSGASQEFYRRVVAPYEDLKRYENGDVYE